MFHARTIGSLETLLREPNDSFSQPWHKYPPYDLRVADLLISGATLVATMDDSRRELIGGWIAITNGLIEAIGTPSDEPPAALRHLAANDSLITPGLINSHHHLFQNLTRAMPTMTSKPLFGWLQTLYPLWARLDEEAAFVSAWVGLCELALSGCTTSTDHLYVHPRGSGDLLSSSIAAAREVGLRFHPTRGSMSLSVKDGGLPPNSIVQDDDEILSACAEQVSRHHDRAHGAMVRVALAPCSPFSVTADLMRRTAELAERLDVRLHTHLAENAEDDAFSLERFGCRPVEYLEQVGWCSDRTWLAHCVMPNEGEIARLGRAGVGVAHCPSSNMILASGIAPVVPMLAAGVPVGLGVDGSSSADSASLWMEARQAMLLAKLRDGAHAGTARMVLEMATRGGAACLGRTGELGELAVGAAADIAVWPLEGPAYAGAIADPIEAWIRCGPTAARHTIVGGKVIVEDGRFHHGGLDAMLRLHRMVSARIQAPL
jgi:cytosine/adenosine deaminase-related metal-dependent hydrolase